MTSEQQGAMPVGFTTMLQRRGWVPGDDGAWRWRPQRRTKWMPEQLDDVLILEGSRIHTIRSLMFLPICYLGPAQDEMAAVRRELGG